MERNNELHTKVREHEHAATDGIPALTTLPAPQKASMSCLSWELSEPSMQMPCPPGRKSAS